MNPTALLLVAVTAPGVKFVTTHYRIHDTGTMTVNISQGNSHQAGGVLVSSYGESSYPWLDCVGFTMPVNMTLARAERLLAAYTHHASWTDVTLRSPLGPVVPSPLFIFEMIDHSFIAVNADNGTVFPIH